MIKEEVIVHTERIAKLGQTKYFQINLPVDAERIIGIETGAFRQMSGATNSGMYAYLGGGSSRREADDPVAQDELFIIDRVETIGRLTLHSPASADVFFQEEIRQKDIAPKYADITQYPEVFGEWTHGRKRYETSVSVKNCSPIIEGHFKDTWGAFYNYHVIYQLNIFIWIEKR